MYIIVIRTRETHAGRESVRVCVYPLDAVVAVAYARRRNKDNGNNKHAAAVVSVAAVLRRRGVPRA